jgi:hypothetical protein
VTSSVVALTVNAVSATCTSGTYLQNVVCAANEFQATLSGSQQSTVLYTEAANTNAQLNVYKTQWNNLPPGMITRPGLLYSSLTTATQTAAYAKLASTALSSAGYDDLRGNLAADDYLGTFQGGYGSGLSRVAFVGTPSATGRWTLMFGGHHLAFNVNYNNGISYPTPHHIGVEPKSTFTVNGTSWQVLARKASTMLAVFYGQADSLSPTGATTTALSSAKLTGTFNDVLIGPVEYNTGSYATVTARYPTAGRGLLVSTLTAAQQALVTAAIKEWTADYDTATAAQLLADYTSTTAYASTYVAWSGSASVTYPDVNANGSYLRIDGPRAWIEIACQGGVVVQGQTHYHMIYRDKTFDYFNQLN